MLATNCSHDILVSTGSDRSVKVWDMSTGDFICHALLEAEATGIVFSDFNPNLLAVAIAKTKSILTFDFRDRELRLLSKVISTSELSSLLVLRGPLLYGTQTPSLCHDSSELPCISTPLSALYTSSQDLLTGHQDGSLCIWRLPSTLLKRVSLSLYPVHCLLRQPGKHLVLTSQQLYHLDPKTLDVRHACELGIEIQSDRARLSQRQLVAPSGSSVVAFEVENGEPVGMVEGQEVFADAVWSGFGLAAIDTRGMLTFWN